MKLIREALVAVVGLASLTGCVMPDQMSQLQKDVADVQQQLRAIDREQGEARQRLEELQQLTRETAGEDAAVGRADLAEVTLRVDQLFRQVTRSDERLKDLSARLDRYSQELAQTRALVRGGAAGAYPGDGPSTLGSAREPTDWSLTPGGEGPGDATEPPEAARPTVPRPSSSALPDPEALYNTAYTDYNKGNYALAIAGFEEYQTLFPESALADNALYWVGECHFSQGDYVAAVDAFDNLLDRYPRTDKAAAANLKKALAFLERNQVGTAIFQLKFVVQNFPGTDEARIAEDKLTGLGQ